MDQTNHTQSRAGARWLAFIGLGLAFAGSVFTWILWQAWQRAEETRAWASVPARVISSQVLPNQATPQSPTKFLVKVRYEYEWQGRSHISERLRRVDGPKSSRDDAEALRERYGKGQSITCYVNPADPTVAILRHESRAALYSLWFPLLFVFGGLRMAWAAWARTSLVN